MLWLRNLTHICACACVYENKTCEVIEEETNEDETVSDLVGCKLCACTFLDQDELDYHMNSGHAVEG